MLTAFVFTIWNQDQVSRKEDLQEQERKATEVKRFARFAKLLLQASCDRKQNFKTLIWREGEGLKYVRDNYQSVLDLASKQNKKRCPLLSISESLPNMVVDSSPSIPHGWESTSKNGVYKRWCKVGECDTSKMYGEQKGSILLLWCKEQACGNIYAQANLLNSSGVVVGYTNDTAYGNLGDKVQITLSSFGQFSRLELTELNLR